MRQEHLRKDRGYAWLELRSHRMPALRLAVCGHRDCGDWCRSAGALLVGLGPTCRVRAAVRGRPSIASRVLHGNARSKLRRRRAPACDIVRARLAGARLAADRRHRVVGASGRPLARPAGARSPGAERRPSGCIRLPDAFRPLRQSTRARRHRPRFTMICAVPAPAVARNAEDVLLVASRGSWTMHRAAWTMSRVAAKLLVQAPVPQGTYVL